MPIHKNSIKIRLKNLEHSSIVDTKETFGMKYDCMVNKMQLSGFNLYFKLKCYIFIFRILMICSFESIELHLSRNFV